MDLRGILARNIIAIRRELGLSQERLAADSKIDRAYFSKIERGIANTGIMLIGRIVSALGVEPAALFKAPTGRKRRAAKARGDTKRSRRRKVLAALDHAHVSRIERGNQLRRTAADRKARGRSAVSQWNYSSPCPSADTARPLRVP